MDESLVDVDAFADMFGDGPAESSENSTTLQTSSVRPSYSSRSAIDLDSLFKGKTTDLQDSSPLN